MIRPKNILNAKIARLKKHRKKAYDQKLIEEIEKEFSRNFSYCLEHFLGIEKDDIYQFNPTELSKLVKICAHKARIKIWIPTLLGAPLLPTIILSALGMILLSMVDGYHTDFLHYKKVLQRHYGEDFCAFLGSLWRRDVTGSQAEEDRPLKIETTQVIEDRSPPCRQIIKLKR